MKTCSLNDFMSELGPWLDKDHIRSVTLEKDGRLTVLFLDGMKNVYNIDDCNWQQIKDSLEDLKGKGLQVNI